MRQVYVVCEGQTEMGFVQDVLSPFFVGRELYLRPTLIGKEGGSVTYARLLRKIRPVLLGGNSPYCTTLVDFYRLPAKFPGKQDASEKDLLFEKPKAIYEALISALANDLSEGALERFIPYVQMHEFEGLLFSDPTAFARAIGRNDIAADLLAIRRRFETPEHINDHPNTAPSKRIMQLVEGYEKPISGSLAALEIGIGSIQDSCPLFNDWLAKLESLPPLPA